MTKHEWEPRDTQYEPFTATDECPECGDVSEVLVTTENRTDERFLYDVTLPCGHSAYVVNVPDGFVDVETEQALEAVKDREW